MNALVHNRILVTGGNGFIGTNLLTHWAGPNGSVGAVLSLDRSGADSTRQWSHEYGERASVDCAADWRMVDINDRLHLAEVLDAFRPSHVVHLAAETSVDSAIADPERCRRDNIEGTFTLLEATRAYLKTCTSGWGDGFRFVYVSTDEVYGAWPEHRAYADEAHEDLGLNPSNPYSASKVAAEALTRAWGKTYGVPFVIVRPCNNFGPFQDCRKLIPNTIASVLNGQEVAVYGDGTQVREWLYVEDFCRALTKIVDAAKPGSVYNVGSGIRLSTNEVVADICSTLDGLLARRADESCRKLVRHVEDRPGHDVEYRIDSQRFAADFGWKPRRDFRCALKETVKWYVQELTR